MKPFFTSAQGPTVKGQKWTKWHSSDKWLTVGLWADVKNGFTRKIIIVLKVRGGHGE